MRRPLAIVGLMVATGTACLLPDLGTYTGGAATDAGVVDVGLSDVGAPDAVIPIDGNTTHFCTGKTSDFCSDFDEGNLLSAWEKGVASTWSSTDVDPTGSLTIDTLAFSAPGALFAQLPRRENVNQTPREQVRKQFNGPWRHLHATFKMYVEAFTWVTGDINAGVFTWACYSDGASTGTVVILGNDYTQAGEFDATAITGKGFPTNAWTAVTLDFDPSGTMRLDYGQLFINHTFTAKAKGANPLCFFTLGIDGFNDPVPAFRIHYDDVVLDFVP